MKTHKVTFAQLSLAVSTRAMLGVGIVLLFADKFTVEKRRAVGWTPVTVGTLTTLPHFAYGFSSC